MKYALLPSLLLAACTFAGEATLAADSAAVATSPHSSLVTRHSSLPAASPYGVCAHLHRVKDPAERAEECRWIASTGIRRVRFDMEWWRVQKKPGGPFDFSHYDNVVADAEAQGLTPLPILFDIPKWAEPVWEHLDEWGAFVEAVVAHYGDRFPDIEIWNEENLRHFWKHDPDPVKYAEVLKTAYLAAKRAGKSATNAILSGEAALNRLCGEAALNGCGGSSAATAPRVLFGGTAGVPLEFIEGVYKAGGAPYFDAMNIHPYSHPRQPEGNLDVQLEAVRALMAKYGDAEKPLLITELGWPTHEASLGSAAILRAGLAIARPAQKSWRVVYAATSPGKNGSGPPTEIAETIEAALPPGSSCEACFGARLRERLATGNVDAVVYPFDETFPADTFSNVLAFVDAGGVLVDAGGMPMWYCMQESEPGVFTGKTQEGAKECREALGIDVDAWWLNPALPNACIKANPTEAAIAAGFRGDPAGEDADRFQTPRLLGPDDEFVPLLVVPIAPLREGGVAEGDGGSTAVAASVIRRSGGRRGCLVISGLRQRGTVGTNSENNQARYLARAMAIAFAESVEQYFWYEFRGREIDPHYSEHHFGLTHRNFTPKPAWGAYRNFTLARPAGSVQTPAPWRDKARELFFPQWTRPSGKAAGAIWTTGGKQTLELEFDSEGISFVNAFGLSIPPHPIGPNRFSLEVSNTPVYFTGGRLVK